MKWTYELDINSDIWSGGICDSREEAIAEATKEALIDNIKEFKIGQCEEINHGIDVDDVLERINNTMYDEAGEVAEDYLDNVKDEHKEELEKELNKVFFAWQEKYKYKPNFYIIVDEEVIVRTDKGTQFSIQIK